MGSRLALDAVRSASHCAASKRGVDATIESGVQIDELGIVLRHSVLSHRNQPGPELPNVSPHPFSGERLCSGDTATCQADRRAGPSSVRTARIFRGDMSNIKRQ